MATKTIGQLTQATTINNADEFAIEQSGVTKRVAASVVRGDIVDANIKSDAAIAYSKLAPLNDAQILVGNGSNVPTAVSVTGDVTISNAGVTAIGSAKVLPAMLSQPYTLATAQNSTSSTALDYTGIPSWVKRITLTLNGVGISGTSGIVIQIGGSSIETSGYTGSAVVIANAAAAAGATAAGNWPITASWDQSSYRISGNFVITNVSSNLWVLSFSYGHTDGTARSGFGGGSKTLSNTLSRIRIGSSNATDTFSAGSINIAYEG